MVTHVIGGRTEAINAIETLLQNLQFIGRGGQHTGLRAQKIQFFLQLLQEYGKQLLVVFFLIGFDLRLGREHGRSIQGFGDRIHLHRFPRFHRLFRFFSPLDDLFEQGYQIVNRRFLRLGIRQIGHQHGNAVARNDQGFHNTRTRRLLSLAKQIEQVLQFVGKRGDPGQPHELRGTLDRVNWSKDGVEQILISWIIRQSQQRRFDFFEMLASFGNKIINQRWIKLDHGMLFYQKRY